MMPFVLSLRADGRSPASQGGGRASQLCRYCFLLLPTCLFSPCTLSPVPSPSRPSPLSPIPQQYGWHEECVPSQTLPALRSSSSSSSICGDDCRVNQRERECGTTWSPSSLCPSILLSDRTQRQKDCLVPSLPEVYTQKMPDMSPSLLPPLLLPCLPTRILTSPRKSTWSNFHWLESFCGNSNVQPV